jgi:hypothetical protein
MKINLLIFVFFAICVQSCTKEVQLDLPQHKPMIVVNSVFTNDSLLKIHISKSNGMFQTSRPWIESAFIKLFENDELIDTKELMATDSGLYISNFIPQESKFYRLEISSGGFNSIECTDFLPKKPILGSICFKDSVYIDEDRFPVSKVEVLIHDPDNNKNFYEIKFKLKYILPDESKYRITDAISYRKNTDIVLQNENILDYYPETLVFSDELFNGQDYNMIIDFAGPIHISSYNGQREYQGYDFSLILYCRSISENYYKYKKQLTKHLYNQDGDIWDGVGDPVQMYTNIEGGYGIFAGYSQVIDTIHE